ncbi:MAG: anti-sigma regulatory factor [Steroidobacteraceae bacterium]
MARQLVRRVTQKLAFSLVDQTKMVTAASELARNALIHGGGGSMRWQLCTEGARNGLKLTFVDEGPGIPNIELAMSDGWTSGSGLGMGLSGAKRLVNHFDIHSRLGAGTRVSITRWK